jgi:hypothetical protein
VFRPGRETSKGTGADDMKAFEMWSVKNQFVIKINQKLTV